MLRLIAIAICALFAGAAAATERLPEGGYVLVHQFQRAEPEGLTISTVTQMQVTGDRLDFFFITYFDPDFQTCEASGKCDRAVNALSARYGISADGKMSLSDIERHDGPRMIIDRRELDHLTIAPVTRLLDGAKATWGDGEIRFHAANGKPPLGAIRPDMRFLASTLEETEAAMDFERMYEQSATRMNRCVLRRVAETRIIPPAARNRIQADFLSAVDINRALEAMQAENSKKPLDSEERFKPTPEQKVLMMAMKAGIMFPDLPPEAALDEAVRIAAVPDTVVEAQITPNRDGLLWLFGHMRRWREKTAAGRFGPEETCAFFEEEVGAQP